MKKFFLVFFSYLFIATLFVSQYLVLKIASAEDVVVQAGQEELPIDLALEQNRPKPKPKPVETKKEEKPAGQNQVDSTQTITLPSKGTTLPTSDSETSPTSSTPTTAPEAPPPPPVAPPAPTEPAPMIKPQVQVPSNVPVISPPAAVHAPAAAQTEVVASPPPESSATHSRSDASFSQDAGGDLSTAFPVTYAVYDANTMGSQDVDTFKLYTRSDEGLGIILKTDHPSLQFGVDLLGAAGELLTQTQAQQPGGTLAFQTSPFDKNGMIYIQIKNINPVIDAGGMENKSYSLELKPIVPPPPPPPPAVQPPPQQKPVKEISSGLMNQASRFLDTPWVRYGAMGVGGIIGCTLVIWWAQKKKKKV